MNRLFNTSSTFAAGMLENSLQVKIGNNTGFLLPERALYFDSDNLLVVSDLHIGKLEYFRKKGIPLPGGALEATLDRLAHLLQKIKPNHVVFLGDLLHNKEDRQWSRFVNILHEMIPDSARLLIEGNHDVLDADQYSEAGITVYPEWKWKGLVFTHEPNSDVSGDECNIAGHIHPAAIVRGKGRQTLRLPCFYHGTRQLILPSFGHFTGSKTMDAGPGVQIYVIAENKVIYIPGESF